MHCLSERILAETTPPDPAFITSPPPTFNFTINPWRSNCTTARSLLSSICSDWNIKVKKVSLQTIVGNLYLFQRHPHETQAFSSTPTTSSPQIFSPVDFLSRVQFAYAHMPSLPVFLFLHSSNQPFAFRILLKRLDVNNRERSSPNSYVRRAKEDDVASFPLLNSPFKALKRRVREEGDALDSNVSTELPLSSSVHS